MNEPGVSTVQVHLRIEEQTVYHIMQQRGSEPHQAVQGEAVIDDAGHQIKTNKISRDEADITENSRNQRMRARRKLR